MIANARVKILMLFKSVADFPGNSLAPGFQDLQYVWIAQSTWWLMPNHPTTPPRFLFEGNGKNLFKVTHSWEVLLGTAGHQLVRRR